MENQEEVWNKIAPEWYEFKTTPAEHVTEFLNNTSGKVLDLGSGAGRHLTKIKNGKIYEVDFSKEMIRLAKKRAETKKIPAEFFVAPLSSLPFEDNFFDHAIWSHSLYCIPDSKKRKQAIEECYRVLKTNSEVLVSIWDKNSKRFEKMPKEKLIKWQDKGQRYYYLYDEKEVHNLFKEVGFKITKQMNSKVNIRFIAKKSIESEKEIVNNLTNLLKKSVQKKIPNSKFGLLLGGIDSSIIALILKKLGYDFTCYVIEIKNGDFKESEDVIYAKKLAKDLNLKLKILKINGDEIEEALKKILHLIKNPHPTQVSIALPLYFGFQGAKKDECKFIFSGVGSDSIFAGFEKHRLAKDLNKECIKGTKECYEKVLGRDEKLAKFQELTLISPFLDKELVNYSLKIPSKYKIKNGVEKYILRKAALKLGLPKYMSMRKKKAIQYSSNGQKSLKKISKQKGFQKIGEYFQSLEV
jgi:ubiquinone/menaquinone biosynthesis C-methylase UbiE